MLKSKSFIAFAAFMLIGALLAGLFDYQQQKSTQQLQLQRTGEQLATHLNAQPATAAELLRFTFSIESGNLTGLAVLGNDGVPLVQVGDTTTIASLPSAEIKHNYRLWHQKLNNGSQLILHGHALPVPLFWLYLFGVFAIAGYAVAVVYQLRIKTFYHQLWDSIPLAHRQQNLAETEMNQLSQSIRQLVVQYDMVTEQAALNLQHIHSQQQLHIVEHEEHLRQLLDAQQQCTQQTRNLQRWQALAAKAQNLKEAELRHWLALLEGESVQSPSVAVTSTQTVADLFAQIINQLKPMWPESILLLPNEDSDASRYQLKMDTEELCQLLTSLMLAIKPLIDGREFLISYRVECGSQDKLHFQFQFAGRSMSARSRQVLVHGENTEPQWEQLPFGICYQFIQRLSAQLTIQELADLGTRLDLCIPVTGQKTQVSRRFQNLAILDPRPCRLDLWRHSLLGVSEQVVAAASVSELKIALQSRLIDIVVVHCFQDVMTDNEVAELQAISSRYQMILFASESMQIRLGMPLIAQKYTPPLLLATVQDLPQPGSQFSSQQMLIVDDNPTNLSFVRAMLSGQGISIDFATTGQEALKFARNSRYQVILMDIQLPDLSGVEVTKQIRQLRHHQHTVILAFTGHALPEEAVSFRLAGMDDVLIKPLDARKIAHIMSRVMPLAETQ